MYSTKEDVKGMLLENEWESIYRAHSWISFSPDKRATQMVTDYSKILQEDLDKLGDNQGNYKEKFLMHFRAWISSKANCASSAITGGANFNVRKAEKANNRERAKAEEFFKFREKYFKSVNRERTLSPEEELDAAQEKYEKLFRLQIMMKDVNALTRKMKFEGLAKDEIEQKISTILSEEDFPDSVIMQVLWNGQNKYGYGFPSFSLTNNNAKIKSALAKIETMKRRIETKKGFENIVFEGGYITIEDDRVKIFHDEKPSQEIITNLKSSGFRWSPFWKCWCRKHTSQALEQAKKLVKIQNK
jgi:hypothetical protein